MPTPLTGDHFGNADSCFVCEPSNPDGLQIPFELSDDATIVSARFSLGPEHSGVSTLVHGGLSLALLDEAQTWAVIAIAGKWALTQTIDASFNGAVFVGHLNTVRAWVVDQNEKVVRTEAVLLDAGDVEVVRSSATFTILGEIDDPRSPLESAPVPLEVADHDH